MTTLSLPRLDWKKQFRLALRRLVEQKWINVGLRAKMGALVLVGLVGLLTIFALLGITAARQTTDQVLNHRLMLVQLSAANLDATLHHVGSMLTVIANQEALRNLQTSMAGRSAALRAGFEPMAAFSEGVYLLDTAGRPLAASTEQLDLIQWTEVPAVQDVLKDQPVSLSFIPGDQPRAAIAVPVRGQANVPIGALVALLNLTDPDVAPFMGNWFDFGPTGTLDVVDVEGNILISTSPDRNRMNRPQSDLLTRLLVHGKPTVESCVGCYTEEGLEAKDQVMAFAPMVQVPWAIVIRQQADEVFAPVRRLTLQTFVLGMAAVVGALALVWVTTNSVIKPVQILMEAAARIAEGDLTTPVCCRRGDEIGALAQNFDAMRGQLKHSMEEVQAWNRELDARVQERTQAARSAQLEAQYARDDLRAIIDGLSDELVVVGLDGRVQQVNRPARQRNLAGPEPIGQYCYQLLHNGQPCQQPEGECPLPAVVATGEPLKVTHTYTNPATGEKRYIDLAASPMRDSSGQVTRVIELRRDVTEEKQMAESLIRRNQQLSILNAVAITVNQSMDLEDILDRSLNELLRLTEIDVGAIFLLKDTLGNLELVAHQGFSEEAARLAARLGMLDGSCGGVIETGQIVVVPDLSCYRGRRAESLKREHIKTLVHVPLIAQGCILGSICVGTRERREFDAEDQELLTALGSQLAVAVENVRLYAEVQRKEHLRGELLKKVITAQEEERKRIARELHDDTSQTLTALLYAVEATTDMLDEPEVKAQLANMGKLVGYTLDGVHKLIFDLRPTMLDHLGLVPALRWFAQSRLDAARVRLSIEETSAPRRLPAEVETVLFRVVQEAINNIARHAGARNARITFDFKQEEMIAVSVEDDGLGFDVVEVTLSPDTQRGLGLMGMRERVELLGGEMEVITAPGFGTNLSFRVPITSRSNGFG